MRRTLALVFVVSLGLAACGGGGGGAAADDPYVVAAREAMLADEEFPASEEEAQCLAERIVGAIGTDELESAGVSAEEFADEDFDPFDIGIEVDEETAREMIGSFEGCGLSITDLMLQGMAADAEVSDELRGCVEENLDEEAFSEAMVEAMLAGDDAEEMPEEFLSLIFGLMSACPELAEFG